MLGTAPLLIAYVYESIKSKIIDPFNFIPFIIFGLTLFKTFLHNCVTYSTKSVLSSSNLILLRFCKPSSLVRGLIMVTQSHSGNIYQITFQILFFWSICSENPFCGFKAFSRYSFDEIFSPSLSTNFKLKSLTTHIKEGKYFESSSGSTSS